MKCLINSIVLLAASTIYTHMKQHVPPYINVGTMHLFSVCSRTLDCPASWNGNTHAALTPVERKAQSISGGADLLKISTRPKEEVMCMHGLAATLGGKNSMLTNRKD
jgi:hypothetical protein